METAEAILAIRSNWPDERYTMLREALTKAIAALEAMEAGQPSTNNRRDEICPWCSGSGIISSRHGGSNKHCSYCHGTGKLSPVR